MTHIIEFVVAERFHGNFGGKPAWVEPELKFKSYKFPYIPRIGEKMEIKTGALFINCEVEDVKHLTRHTDDGIYAELENYMIIVTLKRI